MANLAYVRVSTTEQNCDRQYELFRERKIHIDEFYEEKKSGKNTDRPKLRELLGYIRKGDVVYIESISRIARNTRDFLDIVEKLNEKKVELVSMKESIDTASPQGRFMLSVFASLYQLERENILERQREGIAIALEQRRNGIDRPYGRPVVKCPKDFAKYYSQWKSGKITATQFMRLVDLKRTTFYKMVKEYEKKERKV